MLSRVFSIGLNGIEGYRITVEADEQQGLPGFSMVGLPDAAVRESKERVKSSIINSGFGFPKGKLIINFAPGDIKKEGNHLDLPVAIAILRCMGAIDSNEIENMAFIGELSLNGDIKGVRGVLPMVLEAKSLGIKRIYIPIDNICEIFSIGEISVYCPSNLYELVEHIKYGVDLKRPEANFIPKRDFDIDFSEVKGQKMAKRAVEIAASGSHNILFIGPPGGGKTMIAKRIPTILPELNLNEAIEVTKIYSISGFLKNRGIILNPPFRSPHHSVSQAAFVGGGINPYPGEVSLSHNGVLFLDELPEYKRDVLEALRQPLEDGHVTISRVMGKYTYPSKFMLVSSMNPCPCGYYGYQLKECKCSSINIRNYLNRISGPLLDRIDIHINIEPLKYEELNGEVIEESSGKIKERVIRARKMQEERFKGEKILFNSQMKSSHIKKYCRLNQASSKLLESVFKEFSFSYRAYSKILKVARTIADLKGRDGIEREDLCEAIQYRTLDRKYW